MMDKKARDIILSSINVADTIDHLLAEATKATPAAKFLMFAPDLFYKACLKRLPGSDADTLPFRIEWRSQYGIVVICEQPKPFRSDTLFVLIDISEIRQFSMQEFLKVYKKKV